MTRIAAIADIHFGSDSVGTLAPFWSTIHEHADVFLLAGDLTRVGRLSEAELLVRELSVVKIPIVAVLGNHEFHSGEDREIAAALQGARVMLLDGGSRTAITLDVRGVAIGIAGTKGFGGGFRGACATDFGEPEMKAFVRHTRAIATAFEVGLRAISEADLRIALLHYAPIDETIEGEKRQIYPFLGSYLLGEAIDRAGADIVFHGHAHLGREKGVTPGGIPVRNVAQPVLRHAYNVYSLDREHRSAVDESY